MQKSLSGAKLHLRFGSAGPSKWQENRCPTALKCAGKFRPPFSLPKGPKEVPHLENQDHQKRPRLRPVQPLISSYK